MKTVSEHQYNALKQQFDLLIDNAKANEQLFRRFSDFETTLMESHSLDSLLRTISTGFAQFFDIPYLKLVLDKEIFTHWHIAPVNLNDFDHVMAFDLKEHPHLLVNRSGGLYIGATPKKISSDIHIPIHTLSFAQLPLIRGNTLIGMLNMGSPDSDRFRPDMGTDFLERLRMVTALCFENACNLEQIRQLSLIDGLTNVCNRRAFDDILLQEASSAMRYGRQLGCLFIDIDHFKQINDHYGHQVGDEALKSLAKEVKPLLRRSDHFARYGGEEFAILLPETDPVHSQLIAERIRAKLAKKEHTLLGQSLKMTLSIGVSGLDGSCDTGDSLEILTAKLIKEADEQVYLAKKRGRNQVCVKSLISDL
jgi:diguanylate cyclase (GGDEF)-like protein